MQVKTTFLTISLSVSVSHMTQLIKYQLIDVIRIIIRIANFMNTLRTQAGVYGQEVMPIFFIWSDHMDGD